MYHDGMFGHFGFVAVGQRLVFPEFVTKEQARGALIYRGAIRDNVPHQLDNKTNVEAPQEIEDSKHPFKTAAFSW